MGGSAAHRFLNCTGSTALIDLVKKMVPDGVEGDDPDWRRDGVQAHELGARALDANVDAWELVHEYPQLNPIAAMSVQVYLDYVRSLSGRRRVEVKLHLPELSPHMFSTLDAVLDPVAGRIRLRVVDYKHGEGIFVEAEENDQLKYYACMAVMEDPSYYGDEDEVELSIVQPRIVWADPVRTWVTTVGALKQWLYEVLLPGMAIEARDMHLQMGEWCRFCPAKLVCPAMSQAFRAFSGEVVPELGLMDADILGRDYALVPFVKMRLAAIEKEVYRRRILAGIDVPGSKIVMAKSSREWKDGAEAALLTRYTREQLYPPPKMLSPAGVETLPEGKLATAEWCYTVDNGYAVAQLDDRRKPVIPKTNEEKYGPPEKYVDAPI
jgi:hypothetical protein